MQQYMTLKQGTRPVFAVTVREINNGTVVDAMSDAINIRWQYPADSRTAYVTYLDTMTDDENVVADHINHALGYLEYQARFKRGVPILHLYVNNFPEYYEVYSRRGYTLAPNGLFWMKRLFHTRT